MVTLRSQEILCLSVNVFKNIKIKWGFEFYTHSEDAQTQSDTSLDELTLKTFYETELRMFRAFNLPFPIKKTLVKCGVYPNMEILSELFMPYCMHLFSPILLKYLQQ